MVCCSWYCEKKRVAPAQDEHALGPTKPRSSEEARLVASETEARMPTDDRVSGRSAVPLGYLGAECADICYPESPVPPATPHC